MRTPLEELDPKLTYYTSEGEEYPTYKELKSDDKYVEYAQVTYYCPYCDAPNTCVHSPPLPRGLESVCDNCDERLAMLDPDPEEDGDYLSVKRLENFVERVEKQRKARIVGERKPESVHRQFVTNSLINPLAGFGIMVFVLTIMLSFFIFVGGLLMGEFLYALLAFLVLSTSFWVSSKTFELVNRIPEWISGGVISDTPPEVADYGDFIHHGNQVARDKEELYVPPKQPNDDDKEKELDTEKVE